MILGDGVLNVVKGDPDVRLRDVLGAFVAGFRDPLTH